jgi:hypothetical protein
MTQSQAVELLNQRLLTDFAVAHPTVRYALNNETFKPTSRPFARFIVAGVERVQRSMGPVGRRRFEYRATFVAQLFSDIDRGTLALDTLVDSVHTIFGSKHLSAAGDPMWTKGGIASNPVQREGLHMVNVQWPVSWFNLE